MRTFYGLLLLLGILLASQVAYAGDKNVELDKIVVTPSRIAETSGDSPYTVDVIGGNQLRQSYPQDLAGALETIPSVNVSDYGGLGASKTVRMRGATAEQVLVMVDGRPVNSPRDGQVDLSTIPLSSVDRVEVVHGPGSSLYGSSSMGGIINILTKNPPKQPQTQVTSLAGNHETFIERFSNGATAGRFGYIINGEYQHSKGYRPNSIADASSANSKINYELSDNSAISLNTGYFKKRNGAPGQKNAQDNDDHQLDYKFFSDVVWKLDAGEGLSFINRAYRNYERLKFFENTTGGDRFRHTTVSNGFSSQATKKFTADTVTGGFDYTGNFNDSTSTGKHDYNVRAGYLENILDVTERAKINFGARLDDYSNFGTQINPNAGFVYSFNDTDRIRTAVSKAFRAPTFNDLYWPFEDWGIWGGVRGNPNLKPEKSLNIETGIDKKITDNLSTSLTYFHNRFRNLINWITDDSLISSPSNIDSAEIDGLELSNTLSLTEKLQLNFDYTYQRPKDRGTKKDLTYQPRHRADAGITYKSKDLTCRLKSEFTGTRYTNTANSSKVKQFSVFNFSLDKAITPNVDFLLYLNNILNRKYEVIKDYPAPGFSILAGAKVTF